MVKEKDLRKGLENFIKGDMTLNILSFSSEGNVTVEIDGVSEAEFPGLASNCYSVLSGLFGLGELKPSYLEDSNKLNLKYSMTEAVKPVVEYRPRTGGCSLPTSLYADQI